jgi:hypothetical protein
MNNIKGYDQFVNEELNFQDVKRFGRRVKLEFGYVKTHAVLELFRFLLSWSKEARGAFDELKTFMKRTKAISRLLNKYDMQDRDAMSDDELRDLVKKVADEYDEKYGSFIDDLKKLSEKAMAKPEKILKDPKKQKMMNRIRRMITLLDEDEVHNDDPYNEEEWEEKEEYDPIGILRTGRRMTDIEFINYSKDNLVGKTVIMQPENKIGFAFKDKFKVADVILADPDNKSHGIILIDDKGKWHRPAYMQGNSIIIL